MKKPTNTAKEAQDNPLAGLLGSMNIEAQEAQGQREFIHSDTLPSQLRGIEALIQAGLVVGDVVPDDDLFRFCTLPEGWKRVSTDHSMWSNLVDQKGRVRANIFYKAAFYDRKAHGDAVNRFSIHQDYDREDACVYQVKDVGSVVFTCEPIPYPNDRKDWKYRSAASARGHAEAEAWLKENYPEWADASAYWD